MLKAFMCGLLFPAVILAQDWNQWRGPNRDGIATVLKSGSPISAQPQKVWSVEVGLGYSSPVVSGDAVFIHTRKGEREVVSAFSLSNGKPLWSDSYDASYTVNPAAVRHGPGPKSTPIAAHGKLCTFGISGILSCYDAASGKLLWRNDFREHYRITSPDFGTAMSPLVDQGNLIVHAGGADKGAIFAFDVSTGKQRWSWNGDGPAYASPILIEIGGTRQIITQTQQNIVGVSASDGTLLWKMPFTTDFTQNIITPVRYKDLLIFSGIEKGAFAVRFLHKDGKWIPETVWENKRASMYMSSPVVHGDYLYGMTHYRKGQYFCLDARTGVMQWSSTGDEGENASVISSGSQILFLSSDSELTIVNATNKKYDVVKKITLADTPIFAHPALLKSQMLIKDLKHMTLWRLTD